MSVIDPIRSDLEAAIAVIRGEEEEAWGMTAMGGSSALMWAASRIHDNHGPDQIRIRADIAERLVRAAAK